MPIIEHVQNYINYVGKSVSIVTSTIPIINDGKIEGAIEIFKDLTNVVELSEKILYASKHITWQRCRV